MQTKFKDIAQYYLGTGLELKDDRFGFGHLYKLSTFNISTIFSDKQFSGIKPLLRSLDSLTKPITVKGKTFVPAEALWSVDQKEIEDFENFGEIPEYWKLQIKIDFNERCFYDIKLLLKWHFNIFNLEETEYIKID